MSDLSWLIACVAALIVGFGAGYLIAVCQMDNYIEDDDDDLDD